MSVLYGPNASAIAVAPYNISLLSQRDVGFQVPVDFLTGPGVSISAACFGHKLYEDKAAIQCISNLLAAHFTRLIFDVYWDANRLLWSFCPVELPTPTEFSTPQTSTTALSLPTSSRSTLLNSLSIGVLTAKHGLVNIISTSALSATITAIPSKTVKDHPTTLQASDSVMAAATTSSSNQTTFQSSGITSSNTTSLPVSTSLPSNVEVLYTFGAYTCSTTVNLPILVNLVSSYLTSTDDTLNVILNILMFNVHAAASYDSPDAPALEPNASRLPLPDESIGSLFNANLSSYMYTPNMLQQDRVNLNSSWISADTGILTDTSYYVVESAAADVAVTLDGWPSEEYLAYKNARRLFLGYGDIDPQMLEYNLSADSYTVFYPELIQKRVNTTYATDGTVLTGCIYNQNVTSVSGANSSWAISNDISFVGLDSLTALPFNSTLKSVINTAACGISPILNQTLANLTADVDISPYQEFLYSTIWSWAPGEPSTKSQDETNSFHCAAFDPSLDGRWRVIDCRDSHHAACRGNGQPYTWSIAPGKGHYSVVGDNCLPNSTFATPRTALENQYLLRAYREAASHDDSIASDIIYVNLNSLNVEQCWVMGINGTCPYVQNTNAEDEQNIIVPIVAAVIIIVVAIFTVLVKCGSNRRNSRRKRLVDDGWDYEGVPA